MDGGFGLVAAVRAPPGAAAAIVIGLAVTAFGSSKNSHNQAVLNDSGQGQPAFRQQLELWKDPIQKVAKQRQESGSGGICV